MKYKVSGNCPYCDGERGITTAWGMSPEGMIELKARHDANHPENEQPATTNNFCPNCGYGLKPNK
jgi:hypothetical protein